MRQVAIKAPAKLNLGLEIIGRRPDGFHEIVTILQAISIYDSLTLTPATAISLMCSNQSLEGDDNLVTRALETLRQATGSNQGARVVLSKRIPVAAGLGGASSDAAAALRAGRQLWRAAITDDRLRQLAGRLGSDVPFFLDAGTALGTGRGDEITTLPPLTSVWFMVVTPNLTIPRKTPTLYAALRTEDYSDGGSVRRFAAMLGVTGMGDERGFPPNAFVRPLYALHPELAALPGRMAAAGATMIALSGAGPSHFARFDDPEEAAFVAARLQTDLADAATIRLAAPVVKPPAPVSTYQG